MEASFEFEELRGKNGGLCIDLEKRNVLLFSFFLYIAGGGQSGETTAAPSVFIPRLEQPPPAKAYLRGESRRLIFHVRQWLPVSTMGMDRAYKRGQTKQEMPPCFSFFPSQREREGEEERHLSRENGVVLRFFTRNKPTWRVVENSDYRQTRYEGWKSEPYLGRMVKSVEKCRVCSRACLKGGPSYGEEFR